MTTGINIAVQASARFRDAGAAIVSATQMLAYVNQAYNEINTSTPLWPWLETTEQTISVTAGGRTASLPTDVWTLNWVYNVTDDYRLVPQEGRGDQWHGDNFRGDTGPPLTYRLRGSQIEVFPIPTVTTSLRAEGVLAPAALVADSPVFGQQHDIVLINGALAKAYLDDGNMEWFKTYEQLFRQGIKDMLAWYLFARTETNVPIRDRFWG